MSTDVLREHKVLVFSILGVLLLGGAVWGYTVHARNRKPAIPKELTADALKAESDPEQIWRQVREAMDRKDLTEAQREEIRHNAWAAREARMEARMNEYFGAPANQKQAILDHQIDEMQAFMAKRRAEWDQRRAAGSQPAWGGGPGNANAGSNGNQNGQNGGGQGRGGGREQRKNRSESQDPQQQAKRMAYFSAMHARAEQRGIQMPSWGGGRGGR